MPDSMVVDTQLTSEQVEAILIQPLLADSVVLASGPRMFTGNGVPIRIPKITSYSIDAFAAGGVPVTADADDTYLGSWVSENEQIPEQDPTYDQIVLLPTALRSLKVLHRVSNELVRHAVINIGSALQASLTMRVALALDNAFLQGTGDDDTPKGMVNMTGVTALGTIGAMTVDHLHDAHTAGLAANAKPSQWFCSPHVFNTLRKQKASTAGTYLLQPDPQEANAYRLLGVPVSVTTQLPDTTVILADMSQVAVGRDLGTTVTLLPERYAEFDQLGLRVVARYDIAPLNAAGVVVMTGITG
jgi:HK97 family phage major capsid protein